MVLHAFQRSYPRPCARNIARSRGFTILRILEAFIYELWRF